MACELLQQAFALLREEEGIDLDTDARARMTQHAQLVRQWNGTAALVSEGDAAFLEDRHILDALSLVPYVRRHGAMGLLDIGSGGGFPAIPVKCVLPHLPLTLVERNTRKVGFLQRVVATLALDNVRILHGAFPEAVAKIEVRCITARAVERPQRLIPLILTRMPPECVFLCQSEPILPRAANMFHVEHIEDSWQRAGLRRGSLHCIHRTHT